MSLVCCPWPFFRPGWAGYFSLLAQRKVTKKKRHPDGLPRCAGFPALLALLRARLTRRSENRNGSDRRLASSQKGCGARLRRRGGVPGTGRSITRIAGVLCFLPMFRCTQEKTIIEHGNLYLEFIQERGVGSNDHVASSPASYVSYLKAVSKLIGTDISPTVLRTETDISNIAQSLEGKRSLKTIKNYCSAMRQYIALVETKGL